MTKLFGVYIAICVLLLPLVVTAQHECNSKARAKGERKTTVAAPEEHDYDIKGLKFDIEMTNTSTAVSGNVITYARTNIAGFTDYVFELDNLLTLDSVKINNQLVNSSNITTIGAVRRIALTNPLAVNTDFTAQVFYHGQTPSGNGQFFTGGLNYVKLGNSINMVYSLSDPYFADDWWPCKQSLTDKIDSVAMWITVDDTLKAGCNGLLQKVTALPGNKSRFEWKTNYPIDYYLIAVAVAPYKEYNYYMHFTDGSGDSMLVQNFVYDSAAFLTPVTKGYIDSTGNTIDYFSKLFGRYPFHLEKYGHCITELGGGMEHQTMTFMSRQYISPTLIAHELGHQWWGNNVTYGKWEDIWLSEGMATYTEQLYLEQFQGNVAAKALRTSNFNYVMSVTNGSVWVDDTTNVNRVFDGRLTYAKGGAVAHILRYLAPKDSLFFAGLRTFQQQYKYNTALTKDFKAVMEQTYGQPLDSFFRQWIYGEGYPIYNVRWEQANNVVHVKVVQATSDPSVRVFNVPLQVKLLSANGDTTVTINITDTAHHNIFTWDKTLTSITVDPDNHILDRTNSTVRDPALLSVPVDIYSKLKVYPNPATDGWHLEHLVPGSTIKLYRINGQAVWQQDKTNDRAYIPAAELPQGCYLLQVQAAGGEIYYRKLVK